MKKVLFSLFVVFALMTCVNAEESVADRIIIDGKLNLDIIKPINDENNDAYYTIESQIKLQFADLVGGDTALKISSCSEDISTCDLILWGCDENGGCGSVPIENVQMIYQEDVYDNYSDFFKTIAPNGLLEANSVKPQNEEDKYFIGNYVSEKFPNEKISAYVDNCDADYTNCRLKITKYADDGNISYYEEHQVKFTWKEANADISKMMTELAKKLESYGDAYIVEDLNLLNYYLMAGDDFSKSVNYSKDFVNAINNNSISSSFSLAMGDDSDLYSWGNGWIFLSYNDVIYANFYYGFAHKNIIYIPDETEDTTDAYIKAAKTRIDEYLGNENTKIEVLGKISEYENQDEIESLELGEKIGEYYYDVIIGDMHLPFVIVKDSSKIEKVNIEKTDVATGASVETTSSEVPFDVTLKVAPVEETAEIFKSIINKIKAKTNEIMMFDFKLFSPSKNDYIRKLTNGEFIVSVPIIESLKNKKLIAYYITDDGKIEKHPVTVKDNMATFTTTHFSIYTIAEDNSISVPNTYDGIMNFVIVGIVGIIGIGISLTLRKCKN